MNVPLSALGSLGFDTCSVPDDGSNGQPSAPTMARAFRTGRVQLPQTQRATLDRMGPVSRADAVQLAAELAATQRQLAMAQAQIQKLTALVAGLSRRTGAQVVGAGPGSAGASPRPPPPRPRAAAQAVVDVTPRTVMDNVAAGAAMDTSVDAGAHEHEAEHQREVISPEDIAWYGEHLRGSEPADFGGLEADLDASLGLDGP